LAEPDRRVWGAGTGYEVFGRRHWIVGLGYEYVLAVMPQNLISTSPTSPTRSMLLRHIHWLGLRSGYRSGSGGQISF